MLFIRVKIFYKTRFIGTRKSIICRVYTNRRHGLHDVGQYTFLTV